MNSHLPRPASPDELIQAAIYPDTIELAASTLVPAVAKQKFDQIYYPVLKATIGRPYALYVHGNSDTTGAVRGVETIATGLKWRRLRDPLSIVGEADAAAREACWELGATAAASLMPDS